MALDFKIYTARNHWGMTDKFLSHTTLESAQEAATTLTKGELDGCVYTAKPFGTRFAVFVHDNEGYFLGKI